MKIYKGYELMKAVDDGKLSMQQRVNSLSLDYENCTIDFILKDIAKNVMSLKFEVIEDEINIQEIKECEWMTATDRNIMINKLIKAVKQLDKKLKEKE